MSESRTNCVVDQANTEAVRRIVSAKPYLVDVRPAGEVIAGLSDRDFLHAGPPLTGWHAVEGALRAAILGAMVHLGLARDLDEASEMAEAGDIGLKSASDHNAGGTFAGVIGARTPVLVVENRAAGTFACAALVEGRGKCLRYGANDPETLDRLAWIEGAFAEILGAAVRASGGIDLYEILVQALHMGDDGHSRQKAASALFAGAVAPHVAEAGYGPTEARRALEFLVRNDIFFLPLTMAAGKATMLSVEGIPHSSVITCMAMNGVEFGIKVSALGSRWITGPLPEVLGHYFEGYGAADANPAIGDSEIAETTGLGGFAMAAAPALARYVGGTPAEATRLAMDMYNITIDEHPRFTIPILDYRGTPCGIDLRKVVSSGVTPIFNTGIAHKKPGIGQIGAGYAKTPMACFKAALEAFEGRA
ncbi:MAG TPA: DUF1116 domain-containing protein [Pseudolabrys sp.]|nr:DUF1116 domain-containing protein [Pseudolabrys sp.]